MRPGILAALLAFATSVFAHDSALISITNQWRYHQGGIDLSGQYSQISYDSAWASGRGLLGVESPGVYPHAMLTPLSLGPTTYYFRTKFHFDHPPVGYRLIASNYVDDGAVFYLNGVEVGRIRMAPDGPFTYSTQAENATPEGQVVVLEIPTAHLVLGDNVFAAEVHQASGGYGDVVFGMSLTAQAAATGPVVFTTQPTAGTVEEGTPASFVVDAAGSLPITLQWRRSGVALAGETNRAIHLPFTTVADAGVYTCVASNSFGAVTSSPAALTVTTPHQMLTMSNVWRFHAAGADLGTNWRGAEFDDSAWPSGAGIFFHEGAELPGPKNTALPLIGTNGQPISAYYFRTHFTWSGETSNATLTTRLLLDDGAVLYLNGSEVARVGMTPNPAIISHSTRATRHVADATAWQTLALPASSLRSGDNVLAVEVHQFAANDDDVVFGLALGTNFNVRGPDLLVWAPFVNAFAQMHTYPADDCEVIEGCATPGTRRLLRFGIQTRNQGTEDLVIGSPVGNPLFEFASCHGHYHFHGFVEARLLGTNGALAAQSQKVGFCLEDSFAFDANASDTPRYDCGFQGIQRGWADIYSAGLPCQNIDITDVPGGTYTLEIEVDPENRLHETDEANNVIRVPVEISAPCTAPPTNDAFANAIVLPYRSNTAVGNSDCATEQAGEPNLTGNQGGKSIWYRWVAPASGAVTMSTDGSSFDTLLGVFTGSAIISLNSVAQDDDSGAGTASLVTFNANAGTTYRIVVDGYNGASGNYVLNINPAWNNAFSSCLTLTGAVGSVGGYSVAATKEPGEPMHAGDAGGRSLWYCWTAPFTGPVSFDTFGSRFDTLLAVYTGGTLNALTLVAGNDNDAPFTTSRVTFQATANATYRIAVDGFQGASGVTTLRWRPTLRFANVLHTGTSFQFQVHGAPGERYLIESSTTLTNWALWQRVTNVNGTLHFNESPALGQRFFRVRIE